MNALRFQGVLGSGLSSQAIAWFGGGKKFSHFDCILPNGLLLGARSDAVGGKPPGVQIRPPFYEKWERRTIFELHVSATQEGKWVDFLLSQVGKPYDTDGILGFIFGSNTDRNWRDESAWFCDELMLVSCEKAGCRPLYIDAFRITPNSASIALSAWGFSWKDVSVNA